MVISTYLLMITKYFLSQLLKSMQKTINDDVLIYSNAALVVKNLRKVHFFSKVASWKHATVLKMDSIVCTLSGAWPQMQNRYIHCGQYVAMAAYIYMTKR